MQPTAKFPDHLLKAIDPDIKAVLLRSDRDARSQHHHIQPLKFTVQDHTRPYKTGGSVTAVLCLAKPHDKHRNAEWLQSCNVSNWVYEYTLTATPVK